MEIIITKKARDDLHDFWEHSRNGTENYVFNYINDLIEYSKEIQKNPKIGKIIDVFNQYVFRQLIYRKHKILYIIYNNKIYILRFIHSARKFSLKRKFNLIDYPEI